MKHVIGYTEPNKFGIQKIVYGTEHLCLGLMNSVQYEINDCYDSSRLRIDGIIATSSHKMYQLLDQLTLVARAEGCDRIEYIDTIPTQEELEIFHMAGYQTKYPVNSHNIYLVKNI